MNHQDQGEHANDCRDWNCNVFCFTETLLNPVQGCVVSVLLLCLLLCGCRVVAVCVVAVLSRVLFVVLLFGWVVGLLCGVC